MLGKIVQKLTEAGSPIRLNKSETRVLAKVAITERDLHSHHTSFTTFGIREYRAAKHLVELGLLLLVKERDMTDERYQSGLFGRSQMVVRTPYTEILVRLTPEGQKYLDDNGIKPSW